MIKDALNNSFNAYTFNPARPSLVYKPIVHVWNIYKETKKRHARLK
jgi:hypothetical protein